MPDPLTSVFTAYERPTRGDLPQLDEKNHAAIPVHLSEADQQTEAWPCLRLNGNGSHGAALTGSTREVRSRRGPAFHHVMIGPPARWWRR